MKKLAAFSVFLLTFLISAFASSDIKTAIANIPTAGVLKATFVQKRYVGESTNPFISQGEMIIWNGKGLLWDVKDPVETTILMTQKGLFRLDEEGGKTSLDEDQWAGKVVFDLVTHLLNGAFSQLKDFTPKILPSPEPGKWSLSFIVSKSLRPFISSISVEGGLHIRQITIDKANGDKDVLTFANHKVFDVTELDKVLSPAVRSLFND